MKIVQIIACGLVMCLSAWSGAAQKLEKPAAVKSENIESPRAVLSHRGQEFVAEFQIRSMPDFNRYETFLGEESVPAELAPLQARRATWLIVMDTSDPTGRKVVIEAQKRALMRFLSFVSPESRVGLYRLSRDLVAVNQSDDELPLGVGMREPIIIRNPQNPKQMMINPIFAPVDMMFANNGNENSQMNTNLWVGLTRVLREMLPRLAQGRYANLPKGILLISDGVDESPTSKDDLNRLIQEARALGVPIHTLAFAHKDESNKRMDVVEKHKGFNYLQRLSSETGGRSLSYDMFQVEGDSALKLKSIVESTETALLDLIFSIEKLQGGNDITLQLREGQKKIVASLNISQYDVAQVLGDYWLTVLYHDTNAIRRSVNNDEDKKKLGKAFIDRLYHLPIRDDLFNYTGVDEPFARRARQILAHLDANPDLLNRDNLAVEIAGALINFGAPLPEPRKESQQPVIINNTPPPSANSDEIRYEDDSIQDWVWWSLGIGGSALAVLFFWLIARLAGRSDAPVRSLGQPGESVYDGATKPVFASLVNTANPTQSWVVSSASCRVGRHASNDISLPFSYVSGVQFILSRSTSGQWELRDAQSTNGTMVNGKKVKTSHLNSGDIIRIADLELEFKLRR